MRKQHPRLPYFIHDDGKVKKLRGKGFKMLKTSQTGYKSIAYNRTSYYLHRLVWETFMGDIPEGLQINHKDGDKSNNNLSNLELVTPQQNLRHAHDTGLKGGHHLEKNGMSKLTNAQYLEIIDLLAKGATNKEVSAKHNLHERYVSLIRHKKRLKSLWEKYEKENGEVIPQISSSPRRGKVSLADKISIIKDLPNNTNKKLAERVGVDPSVISNVRYKKYWLEAWSIVEGLCQTTRA